MKELFSMEINILKNKEAATLRELIAASNRIVICCHKSPDGDALGSSLAWARYLMQHGKTVSICIPDMAPDFLTWLPGAHEVIRYDKHQEQVSQLFADADLVCCLDFNSIGRLEEMAPYLEQSKAKRILIDHHLGPDLECDLMISRPQLCSTSELIFRIVWQLGEFDTMDKLWATCVYCGMMTDTGGFTYASTDPAIYFIISQLLTKNINKDKIYRNVYNNYSSWAIRFRGYVMCHKLNAVDSLHASYFSITKQEMREYHFTKGDLEGLVNEPLRIKGQKLSISLREDTERENFIMVSLRSVDDFPCNKMAAEFFNGGGHLNASGGKLMCSIEEAEQVVIKAIMAYQHLLR